MLEMPVSFWLRKLWCVLTVQPEGWHSSFSQICNVSFVFLTYTENRAVGSVLKLLPTPCSRAWAHATTNLFGKTDWKVFKEISFKSEGIRIQSGRQAGQGPSKHLHRPRSTQKQGLTSPGKILLKKVGSCGRGKSNRPTGNLSCVHTALQTFKIIFSRFTFIRVSY